jgi:hypothetical protein
MARIVAAFGTSHSTMLFSSAENWLKLFDHVDRARSIISSRTGRPMPMPASRRTSCAAAMPSRMPRSTGSKPISPPRTSMR